MIYSFLRSAFRSIINQKWFSLLHITGLVIGILGFILLSQYVYLDLTWDKQHDKGDRIYRMTQIQSFGGVEPQHVAYTMPPLAPAIKQDLPEVLDAVRYYETSNFVMEVGDTKLFQDRMCVVDSTFLEMFSYPVIAGDLNTMLDEPSNIAISQNVAETYFDDRNPMGQIILVDNQYEFVVSGIFETVKNSHLDFEVLIPFSSADRFTKGLALDGWGNNMLATYILVAPETDQAALEAKLPEFFLKYREMDGIEFYLQKLGDLHLHSSHVKYEINNMGTSPGSVYIITSICLLMLLIAVINYVNLSTARSALRAREVGLRKIVGAGKTNLVLQFLGESYLLVFFATVLAVVLEKLLEPHFVEFSGRAIAFNVLDGGFGTFSTLCVFLVTGFLAGIYPAVVLSGHQPLSMLRGRFYSGKKGGHFRRILVVTQFVITVTLIISSITLYQQLEYSRSRALGYEKEQIYSVIVGQNHFWDNEEQYVERFKTIPGVKSISSSSGLPNIGGGSTTVRPEGQDEDNFMISYTMCDENAAATLGYKVSSGRFFSDEFKTDVMDGDLRTGAIVLNEAAVRSLGWEDPIGRIIEGWGFTLTVVGVVEDFHYTSTRRVIEPLMMMSAAYGRTFLTFKLDSHDIEKSVADIESLWNEIMPDLPIRAFFMDERFDHLYRSEMRTGNLLRLFSGLTIFLSSLGLIGLAAFTTQRRSREIAIRKVLGANRNQILKLVTGEISILVLVANVIAWPITFYLMNRWLENFAYHINLAWWLFPAAGAAVLATALLSIGFIALKAVMMNPAETVRHE